LSSIIGHPGDEGDLAALALAVGSIVLDVVDGVAAANAGVAPAVVALGADELLAESLVVILAGLLLDDNLLPVIGDLVDDPLEALAELELVEGSDALGSDGDTGGEVLMVVGGCEVVSCAVGWAHVWWDRGGRWWVERLPSGERTYPDEAYSVDSQYSSPPSILHIIATHTMIPVYAWYKILEFRVSRANLEGSGSASRSQSTRAQP
jgi:hypothetical protein